MLTRPYMYVPGGVSSSGYVKKYNKAIGNITMQALVYSELHDSNFFKLFSMSNVLNRFSKICSVW